MTVRSPLTGMTEPERSERLKSMGFGPDLLPLTLTPEERSAALNPGLPNKEPRMADTTPVVSTGFSTSEGKLTIVAMVVGFLLESVAVPLLTTFQAAHPGAVWVPIALAVLGALIQVAALFGYQKSRTALKLADKANQ